MELRFSTPFPIFSPNQTSHHPSTEIKFSRWNNANAEPFLRIQRSQKQVEDEIRRERRFESASLISVDGENDVGSSRENPEFKSVGTPSSPSRRSIPGKFSKYSKEPKPKSSHPAFRRVHRVFKPRTEDVSIREDGVSYQIPNAPFAFQYSYTETPKMKPLALREPPFVPFGPTTMPRPWTGRAPLPPSKKKLPEFDSFRLPPPHKKGVKPVQAPGPFLAGSAPKYVYSREEILGEPLSEEEIKAMIQSTMRTTRQLNMGRDGLTHNMLTNIHALWKRRRVCKIKCKGVCTVDMENVRQQLEEKTGGKIIYCRGGVIFLFRGRNYNYKTRPQYPLMLWKPATPVYPRLIKRVPDGLTLEEVTEMRKIGHKLPPICKLGKNGVYIDLVKNVKEAFEECELVSINCQGLNPSDYKKIGAKLKDLVPCILISFERESILMWRGRDWKSSLPSAPDGVAKSIEDGTPTDPNISSDLQFQEGQIISNVGHDICLNQKVASSPTHIYGEDVNDGSFFQAEEPLIAATHSNELNTNAINEETSHSTLDLISSESDEVIEDHEKCKNITESDHIGNNTDSSKSLCTQGVLHLWKQAVESGSALVLDSQSLDANIVFEKAVAHAKTAPSCATFKQSSKASNPKSKGEKSKISELKDDSLATTKSGQEKKVFKNQTKRLDKEDYPVVVPHGSLRVDELAKLLL